MPLTVATATSAALEVRRGRPRSICYDIVGWTCANVNETQNSFAEATQTSRVASATIRATPVSRKNSFPLHGGRRDIASTRSREESARDEVPSSCAVPPSHFAAHLRINLGRASGDERRRSLTD